MGTNFLTKTGRQFFETQAFTMSRISLLLSLIMCICTLYGSKLEMPR